MSRAPINRRETFERGDGRPERSAVSERAEAFTAGVLAEAMNRPVQMVNGGLYVRGLLEQGAHVWLRRLT